MEPTMRHACRRSRGPYWLRTVVDIDSARIIAAAEQMSKGETFPVNSVVAKIGQVGEAPFMSNLKEKLENFEDP